MKRVADRSLIEQLQKQICDLQTLQKSPDRETANLDLGAIERPFPEHSFPRGSIHELISTSSEEATSTSGFLSVILGKLMQPGQFCLWISTTPRRSIFPPALKLFGIDPDRILFVDVPKSKETLWALEEALKCDALAAVVGEINEINFNDSRRLQLAVEKSNVTGFIHRFRPKTESALACVSRWKITPLPSVSPSQLPGLGFPAWNVKLLKVRNGKPGEWQVVWTPKGLEYIQKIAVLPTENYQRQTG